MPTIRNRITLAAGQTIENVLVGSAFEFAREAQQVEIGLTQELPGAGVGTPVAAVQFGPEVQMETGGIPVERTAGGGPIVPDDIVVADAAAPGDRLKITFRNTDGANPVDVGYVVKTTIIPM